MAKGHRMYEMKHLKYHMMFFVCYIEGRVCKCCTVVICLNLHADIQVVVKVLCKLPKL